jgi:hypothetical protein
VPRDRGCHRGLVIGVARKGDAEQSKAQYAHTVVNDLADLFRYALESLA